MSIWEQWNNVDPRYAERLALKTQVTKLEKKRTTPPKALTTAGKKTKKGIREPHLDLTIVENTKIFKWHTVKKGATVKVGSGTIYWWKNHEPNEKWDGLYYWHTPKDCPNLVPRSGGKTAKEVKDKDKSKSEKLQLKSNLKTILMSNFCLSSEDVEKIFSEAQAQEN